MTEEERKLPPIPKEIDSISKVANALMMAAGLVDWAMDNDPTGIVKEYHPRLAKTIRKAAKNVDAGACRMLAEWLKECNVRLI